MVLCPECESDLDVAEDEVDEGEIVSCPECGQIVSAPFPWEVPESSLRAIQERLSRLNSEIETIKAKSEGEAAAERERIAQSTEAEISKLTVQAQRDIENAGKAAKNELRRFTAEQSVRMAEELIKRDLRPEDDVRLIGRNIEEMGAAR